MNFRLSTHHQDFLREKVATGGYRSEDDVIADALSLLEQHDKARMDALLAAIDEGEADLREGRFVTLRTKEELDAYFAKL